MSCTLKWLCIWFTHWVSPDVREKAGLQPISSMLQQGTRALRGSTFRPSLGGHFSLWWGVFVDGERVRAAMQKTLLLLCNLGVLISFAFDFHIDMICRTQWRLLSNVHQEQCLHFDERRFHLLASMLCSFGTPCNTIQFQDLCGYKPRMQARAKRRQMNTISHKNYHLPAYRRARPRTSFDDWQSLLLKNRRERSGERE